MAEKMIQANGIDICTEALTGKTSWRRTSATTTCSMPWTS